MEFDRKVEQLSTVERQELETAVEALKIAQNAQKSAPEDDKTASLINDALMSAGRLDAATYAILPENDRDDLEQFRLKLREPEKREAIYRYQRKIRSVEIDRDLER